MATKPKFGVNNYKGSTKEKDQDDTQRNQTKNFLEKCIGARADNESICIGIVYLFGGGELMLTTIYI